VRNDLAENIQVRAAVRRCTCAAIRSVVSSCYSSGMAFILHSTVQCACPMYAIQASSYTTIVTKRFVMKCAANLSSSAFRAYLRFSFAFWHVRTGNCFQFQKLATSRTSLHIIRKREVQKTRFKVLGLVNQRSSCRKATICLCAALHNIVHNTQTAMLSISTHDAAEMLLSTL
jgi:hypothetical protein